MLTIVGPARLQISFSTGVVVILITFSSCFFLSSASPDIPSLLLFVYL